MGFGRGPGRRGLLIGAVVLLALAALGAPAAANHSWKGKHWARESNPFTLKIGDNLDGRWQNELGQAKGDWQDSAAVNLNVVGGGTSPGACNPTEGRVEVCNADYGRNDWLGLTTIWFKGDHITKAVVQINDYYFAADPDRYDDPTVRRKVLCHELGHALGLDHTGGKSCINHKLRYLDARAYAGPSAHDYDQLDDSYRHRDGKQTVAGAEPEGVLTSEAPAVVEDLGDGTSLASYVFPAEQAAPPDAASFFTPTWATGA